MYRALAGFRADWATACECRDSVESEASAETPVLRGAPDKKKPGEIRRALSRF
jgi:hypothetical protein